VDDRRSSSPAVQIECNFMATLASRQTIEARTLGKLEGYVSILLVDDDPGAIQLMGRILASVGTLRYATNGRDALRLALDSTPRCPE
jgi:hypothetical protein